MAGAAFLSDAVRAASEAGLGEHLEAGLSGTHVDLRVSTNADGGGIWVTADDVTLARRLSEVARRHSVVAVPGEVSQVELGLDTAFDDRLGPFWAAVLTGDAGAVVADTVFDPTGQLPSIWFQGTEPHDTPRQRWHLDLWVAPEVAQVAHRRRGGGRRHRRRRLRGTVVHGARRPRRQQGVRLHPPRPGLTGGRAPRLRELPRRHCDVAELPSMSGKLPRHDGTTGSSP